jgi:hypothetical protein
VFLCYIVLLVLGPLFDNNFRCLRGFRCTDSGVEVYRFGKLGVQIRAVGVQIREVPTGHQGVVIHNLLGVLI